MSEKEPIGYRVIGARAEYNVTTGKYDVIPEELDSGAVIEKNKDGKFFFTTEEQVIQFCAFRMPQLSHVIIEEIYAD